MGAPYHNLHRFHNPGLQDAALTVFTGVSIVILDMTYPLIIG
jgi:hypothetical protein